MAWFEVTVVVPLPQDWIPTPITDGGKDGTEWRVTRRTESDLWIQAADTASALKLGWDELCLERDTRDRWHGRAVSRTRTTVLTMLVTGSTLAGLALGFLLTPPETFGMLAGALPFPPVFLMAGTGMIVVAVDLMAVRRLSRIMVRQAAALWLRQVSSGTMEDHP